MAVEVFGAFLLLAICVYVIVRNVTRPYTHEGLGKSWGPGTTKWWVYRLVKTFSIMFKAWKH
jgi:hypothetical protein